MANLKTIGLGQHRHTQLDLARKEMEDAKKAREDAANKKKHKWDLFRYLAKKKREIDEFFNALDPTKAGQDGEEVDM